MTAEYDRLMSRSAEHVAETMRQAGAVGRESAVCVWAIYTTADADGYLYAGTSYPDGVPMSRAELVRPPPHYRTWASVPYSRMRGALHEVCRRLPILPLERAQ